jgi:hypothetical protein
VPTLWVSAVIVAEELLGAGAGVVGVAELVGAAVVGGARVI